MELRTLPIFPSVYPLRVPFVSGFVDPRDPLVALKCFHATSWSRRGQGFSTCLGSPLRFHWWPFSGSPGGYEEWSAPFTPNYLYANTRQSNDTHMSQAMQFFEHN